VLADASGTRDGYLIGRYEVPITDDRAMSVLRLHCCAIARFLLMTAQPDEAATKAYDQAVAYLTAVGKGSLNLLPPAAAAEPAGVGSVEFEPGTKWFGRDTSGWRDC
jgi:phage gp36-like protein